MHLQLVEADIYEVRSSIIAGHENCEPLVALFRYELQLA